MNWAESYKGIQETWFSLFSSSSLGSSRFGNVRNWKKRLEIEESVLIPFFEGLGEEEVAKTVSSGPFWVLPRLIFQNESVVYDLIAWEVLIYFICDNIYVIATNNL